MLHRSQSKDYFSQFDLCLVSEEVKVKGLVKSCCHSVVPASLSALQRLLFCPKQGSPWLECCACILMINELESWRRGPCCPHRSGILTWLWLELDIGGDINLYIRFYGYFNSFCWPFYFWMLIMDDIEPGYNYCNICQNRTLWEMLNLLMMKYCIHCRIKFPQSETPCH